MTAAPSLKFAAPPSEGPSMHLIPLGDPEDRLARTLSGDNVEARSAPPVHAPVTTFIDGMCN
jgi:hypothetical protein